MMNTVFACRIHGKLVALVCSCSLGEGVLAFISLENKQVEQLETNLMCCKVEYQMEKRQFSTELFQKALDPV